MTVTIETKLYTTIGEFNAPMSMEEVKKQLSESSGILRLERFAISNRAIRDEKTQEQTLVDANTKITVELDTNKCPVLCFEEYHMTDVEKKDSKPKK